MKLDGVVCGCGLKNQNPKTFKLGTRTNSSMFPVITVMPWIVGDGIVCSGALCGIQVFFGHLGTFMAIEL